MMMNILEQEDLIKGLPDQVLMQQAQMPTGEVPQFLVVSEIQRRSDMRKRFQENKPQEGTVKDRIVGEAGMGIMGAMPPQGMPPQGMPPQMAMAPQMPQQMPQMPPQEMPPQMMSSGGLVKKMQTGGITSMPGAGALVGAQKEYIDPLVERAKVLAAMGVASFEDALAQLQAQAQMNMPNYSMLGKNDLMASASEMGQKISDLGVKGADAMRDAYAAIPQYSTGDPLQGVKDLAGNFAFDSAMNMPNYQLLGRNDLSLPSAPELSTASQRGAGGRPFDLGGISDVMPDLGMPTREQRIAADRAKVESIRSGLGDSVTSQDVDDAVAGMVTERAPRSGGFGGIVDALGGMFDFGLSERYAERYPERVAANEQTKSDIASFFNRSPQMERYQSMLALRQNPGMLDYETNIESKLMSDYDAIVGGDYPAGSSGTLADTFGISKGDASVQGKSDKQKQADGSEKELLLEEVTVDRERKDLSGILSELVKTPSQDRSNKANDPTLDFSDLIADSRRQAMSNALIQLGAGIAGGDVSKGIAAAGQAATEGTQAARDLDMNRRLAEFKAGREDLRRQDEADRFAEELGLRREKLTQDQKQFVDRLEVMREDITAKLGISQNANNREILDAITDAIPLANTQAERDRLARQRMFILRLLNQDFAKLLDESEGAGAGGERQAISDFGS